jgi:hypothetical protein
MKVGFTGTENGLTIIQNNRVIIELTKIYHQNAEFHHGWCVGADEQVMRIAYAMGYKIVAHPGVEKSGRLDTHKRARSDYNSIKKAPKFYLDRNKDIVNDTERLIACPYEKHEVLRSGTWATVRYARTQKRPIMVIYRDGSVKEENASTAE